MPHVALGNRNDPCFLRKTRRGESKRKSKKESPLLRCPKKVIPECEDGERDKERKETRIRKSCLGILRGENPPPNSARQKYGDEQKCGRRSNAVFRADEQKHIVRGLK